MIILAEAARDILDSLRDGAPRTAQEIWEDTGRARDRVYDCLSALAGKGLVTRSRTGRRGTYAITLQGLDELETREAVGFAVGVRGRRQERAAQGGVRVGER